MGVGWDIMGDFLPLPGSALLLLPSLPFPSTPAFRSLSSRRVRGGCGVRGGGEARSGSGVSGWSGVRVVRPKQVRESETLG